MCSSSWGMGIFCSAANFFSDSYLSTQASVSSCRRRVSSWICSRSCHSCEGEMYYLYFYVIWSSESYLRLLRFQFVLLLDPLDPAAGRVSAILQRSPALLHPDDLVAGQTAQLQRPIEIAHRDRNEFVVADVGNRAGRKGRLMYGLP